MEKNKSKSLLSFSFAQGFTSPNIPIATFCQDNKELNFIIDTGCGAHSRISCRSKSAWNFRNDISMAHPGHALSRETFKEEAPVVEPCLCFPIFPCCAILCRDNFSAEFLSQKLAAITDAEDRYIKLENLFCRMGRVLFINTSGSA